MHVNKWRGVFFFEDLRIQTTWAHATFGKEGKQNSAYICTQLSNPHLTFQPPLKSIYLSILPLFVPIQRTIIQQNERKLRLIHTNPGHWLYIAMYLVARTSQLTPQTPIPPSVHCYSYLQAVKPESIQRGWIAQSNVWMRYTIWIEIFHSTVVNIFQNMCTCDWPT